MVLDKINLVSDDIFLPIHRLDDIEMYSVSEDKILATGRLILEPKNCILVKSLDEWTLN